MRLVGRYGGVGKKTSAPPPPPPPNSPHTPPAPPPPNPRPAAVPPPPRPAPRGAARATTPPPGPRQQPLGIHRRALDARAPQRLRPDGERRLHAGPRVDQRVWIHRAAHDSTFCSRSACSAAVSPSMISSRSPSRTAGRRYSVSPMRWSLTRPSRKL